MLLNLLKTDNPDFAGVRRSSETFTISALFQTGIHRPTIAGWPNKSESFATPYAWSFRISSRRCKCSCGSVRRNKRSPDSNLPQSGRNPQSGRTRGELLSHCGQFILFPSVRITNKFTNDRHSDRRSTHWGRMYEWFPLLSPDQNGLTMTPARPSLSGVHVISVAFGDAPIESNK